MSNVAMQRESNEQVVLHVVDQQVVDHDAAQAKAMLVLDAHGMIRECNRAAEQLFKYPHNFLVWQSITLLIPDLAGITLLDGDQPNSRLRFLCRIGHQFQAVSREGDTFACDLFLNLLDGNTHGKLALIICPIEILNDYSARPRPAG